MKKVINIQELHPQHQNGELIILKGTTTSRVEQALKGSKTHGQSPYPARVFLKVDNQGQQSLNGFNKPLEDIPVFFRIRERKEDCHVHYGCPWYCDNEKGGWIRPKIKKGSYLQVEGHFSIPTNSSRPSFTAYKYFLHE